MGAVAIFRKTYTIEMFNEDITPSTFFSMNFDELFEKLTKIYEEFKANSRFYEEFIEVEGIEMGPELLEMGLDLAERRQPKKPNLKFLQSVSKILTFSIPKEHITNIYSVVLDLTDFLIIYPEYTSYFLENTAEKLSRIISSYEMSYSIEIYHKVTTLIKKFLELKIKENKLNVYFNELRRLMMIPKKLNDNAFCKDPLLRENLLEILLQILDILYTFYKDKNNKNYQDNYIAISNILTEYHQSGLFSKLSTEIIEPSCTRLFQVKIFQIFNMLTMFDFVVIDRYLVYDTHIIGLSMLFEKKTTTDEVFILALLFMINYHKIAYNLGMGSFKMFLDPLFDIKEALIEKMVSCENDEINILICLLLLTVSVNGEIWESMTKINIVAPIIRTINKYIINTFSKKEYYKDGLDQVRLSNVKKVVDNITFICTDEAISKIYHVDLYKHLSEIAILLIQIYHPSFQEDIPWMVSKLTNFFDAKNKFLNPKKERIILNMFFIIEDIFTEIKNTYESYQDFIKVREKILYKIENIDFNADVVYIDRYNSSLAQIDQTFKTIKACLKHKIHQMAGFVSALGNLMIGSDPNYQCNVFLTLFAEFEKKKADEKKKASAGVVSLNKEEILEDDERDQNLRLINYYDEYLSYLENTILPIYLEEELAELKEDLFKDSEVGRIYLEVKQDIMQLILLKTIRIPKIESLKAYSFNKIETNIEFNEFMIVVELIEMFIPINFNISSKLAFILNRFIQSQTQFKPNLENLKVMSEKFLKILNMKRCSVLNREILRLFCNVTSYNENTFLGLRFSNKKYYCDDSNNSDIIISYKKKELGYDRKYKNKTDKDTGRIISLLDIKSRPKIEPYSDKYGAIFYKEHSLIIPKKLFIGHKFTIYFRFYYPFNNSNKFHTLLQSSWGIGGLIVVDPQTKKIGCFTESSNLVESQNYLDAKIDLANEKYKQKWTLVTLCYDRRPDIEFKKRNNEKVDEDWGILEFYINGERSVKYKEVKMPSNVMYIGNSKDYDEPWGEVADIRIYRNYYNDKNVMHLKKHDEKKEVGEAGENDSNNILVFLAKKYFAELVSWFLGCEDKTEETIYFTLKLFNNLYHKTHEKKFIRKYEFLDKVFTLYGSCKKNETRKELAKLVQNLE